MARSQPPGLSVLLGLGDALQNSAGFGGDPRGHILPGEGLLGAESAEPRC